MVTLTAVIISAALCAVIASYVMLWVNRKSGVVNMVVGVVVVFAALFCAIAIAFFMLQHWFTALL